MAPHHRIPARTLHRVWAPFARDVQARLGDFLNELDDRLLDAAERATDSQRAGRHLTLSRQIRMARDSILHHFRDRLSNATPDEHAPASDLEDELRLMDEADTEREVALRKLVQGAYAVMTAEVDALETVTRDYQLATTPEEAHWHPHALGEAFLEALEAEDLPPEDNLMLLHWFDRDVVRTLQPQMQALLQAFRDAGFVAPDIPTATGRSRQGGGPAAPAAASGPATGAPEPPPAPTANWAQFGYQVPVAGQVVATTGASQGSPVEAITTLLSQASPSTLEPFIMDLLQGLFDMILKRRDLNPALRESLSDLQLPLVRIAMHETDFFRDRGHPARQMTGLLLNIALRIDPDLPLDEARELPLSQLVFENVERVRNGGLDDREAFAEALTRLQDDLARAEERISAQAADAQAEAQQAERTLEISHDVESTVERTVITRGQDIPDAAREQLMDAWVPLMTAQKTAEAAAEPGNTPPGSPDTGTDPGADADTSPDTDGMALLQELLDLMRQEPDFQKSAPLLARIRAFLDRAPLSPEERTRIKQDLVSAHLVAAGKRRPTAPEQGPEATSEVESQSQTETATATGPDKPRERSSRRPHSLFGDTPRHADDDPSLMRDHDDEHVERAEHLASGTWIQFTSPAGTRVTRMKLVWRGTHSGRLLFADATGRSKRQHSIQGLAHEFRTGRAQIIPEDSLFDHLMEQRLGQSA
ncbi:DUF1631 family protein [Thioalkalivibrio sp. ALJT]|uniref:DUF1631 family protein n=1 Tax=Thioalkalivibrio sp. ALJT TaxID=1158146 RepID=UPI000476C0DC|nr:DUF1631 family protein [Thioalkalivibrio sp. ALJT]